MDSDAWKWIAGIAGGLTAIIGTVCFVVYVKGQITKTKLREEALKNGIKEGLVKNVDHYKNVVTIQDMRTRKKMEVHGDGIAADVHEKDRIYV